MMCKYLSITAFSLSLATFCVKAQEKSIRPAKPFHTIEVGSGIDLHLKQSDTLSIEVESPVEYIDRIQTKISDSVLIIKAVQPMRWGYEKSPKVYVAFNQLKSLIAISGADVYGTGVFGLGNLSIVAHSGADIYITLECQTLRINAREGSGVKVSGKARSLKAIVGSGSDLNAGELKADHCEITANGGSDAIVNVAINLEANANDGSNIGYIGNPAIKELTESGGSDIYRR
ncbi:MAG: head GIN domain-containing protein [Breznakibacter sp.]